MKRRQPDHSIELTHGPVISVMLAVPDATAAAQWYAIARAVAAGADGSVDDIRDHERPWGIHRQGGFTDPFGHIWLVGDRSPLRETTDNANQAH